MGSSTTAVGSSPVRPRGVGGTPSATARAIQRSTRAWCHCRNATTASVRSAGRSRGRESSTPRSERPVTAGNRMRAWGSPGRVAGLTPGPPGPPRPSAPPPHPTASPGPPRTAAWRGSGRTAARAGPGTAGRTMPAPPVRPPARATVSTPSAAVRSWPPTSPANPGRDASRPGVLAQPGCMALATTPVPRSRRAHSRISATWARFARAYDLAPAYVAALVAQVVERQRLRVHAAGRDGDEPPVGALEEARQEPRDERERAQHHDREGALEALVGDLAGRDHRARRCPR